MAYDGCVWAIALEDLTRRWMFCASSTNESLLETALAAHLATCDPWLQIAR